MLNLYRHSFQALIRTTQVLLISFTVVLASGCSGGGSGPASAPPSGDGVRAVEVQAAEVQAVEVLVVEVQAVETQAALN